jgi:hypothetical protein
MANSESPVEKASRKWVDTEPTAEEILLFHAYSLPLPRASFASFPVVWEGQVFHSSLSSFDGASHASPTRLSLNSVLQRLDAALVRDVTALESGQVHVPRVDAHHTCISTPERGQRSEKSAESDDSIGLHLSCQIVLPTGQVKLFWLSRALPPTHCCGILPMALLKNTP